MERPWQALVRELRDRGYESPSLDRLRTRLDVEAAQEELEKEIIREMAAALPIPPHACVGPRVSGAAARAASRS